MVAGARRPYLVLWVVIVVGFVATIAVLRTWNDKSPDAREPTTSTARAAIRVQAPAHVRATVNYGNRQQENPAAQKAGTPDPEAQRLSADSAESAARAAADLAASK